jgi:hypothetical protein
LSRDSNGNTLFGDVGSNKQNLVIGQNAGGNLVADAFHNVLLGAIAGRDLTSGDANTIIGRGAGTLNTVGNSNTYIGDLAGNQNVGGAANTFLGRSAGENNTGTGSILIGFNAGKFATSSNQLFIENSEADSANALIYGDFNTDWLRINGRLSPMEGITDADGDTKIQVEASPNENMIRFDLAGGQKMLLNQNVQGNPLLHFSGTNNNVFIGNGGANVDNSSGNINNNTFIGMGAGVANTTGENNTFIGHNAGNGNMTGDGNVLIGEGAGQTGDGNGRFIVDNGNAGDELLEGTFPVNASIEGYLRVNGVFEASAGISGDDEYVMVIDNSLTSPTGTDKYNGLKIEAGRDVNNSANSKMIAFHRPDGDEIGKVVQNNSGTVNYATTSDVRLKKNIRETQYSLNDLLSIEVKDYEYKSAPDMTSTGFIAQQLYTLYPEAVSKGGDDAGTDPWMVDYGKLTPLLVKAVQDLSLEVEFLRSQLEEQRVMIGKFTSRQ